MRYAKAVIENRSRHTDTLFTYRVPDTVQAGDVIRVPFGKGDKQKRAFVFSVSAEPDLEPEKIKDALGKDEVLYLTEEMRETCLWMRQRYGITYLEAVRCFIPPGKKAREGKEKRPLEKSDAEAQAIEKLTEEQRAACARIFRAIDEGRQKNFLIHGVTGSGKTEIYLQATARTLAAGRNVIILVPEIALTKQMTARFIGRFGKEQVAVLHSSLTGRERFDEWVRIRSGQARIVIGARMAVFSPLDEIGLIVMDEEHEATYKADMSPKYETVDIAIKRLLYGKGILLCGSATPSVTSYRRAEEGIYELIELKKRYNEVRLPAIQLVDMREELKQGNRGVFSGALYRGIAEEIQAGRQAILFLNRRGYSNYMTCATCGATVTCPDCGIPLTYHKSDNAGVCHYCGRKFRLPKECPDCGSPYIRYVGIGTEQLEELTRDLFPEARVARLDLDTAKGGRSISRILNDFAAGKTDVLIGTQLVAKGLDFRNVGLVGVVQADTTLNIPDYRSAERTFQLITQVAGRAGRGDREGRVIVQTLQPENPAVQAACAYDYQRFYRDEIRFRGMMGYPPFTDLVLCETVYEKEQDARRYAEEFCVYMKGKAQAMKERPEVYDPRPSYLTKTRKNAGSMRYDVLIKAPRGARNEVIYHVRRFAGHLVKTTSGSLLIDVNPYGML